MVRAETSLQAEDREGEGRAMVCRECQECWLTRAKSELMTAKDAHRRGTLQGLPSPVRRKLVAA